MLGGSRAWATSHRKTRLWGCGSHPVTLFGNLVFDMDLYGSHSSSRPQKVIIVSAEVGLIALSYFVLFGDVAACIRAFGTTPNHARNALLFTFNIATFFRFLLTLFLFLRRKVPVEETFSVPLAFALYLVGFPLMARGAEVPLGIGELIGAALFIVGACFNTVGEYQRYVFKKDPAHAGQLYDRGLFSLSIHINYFGDLLWVTGYACVTSNPYAFIVPAVLFAFFLFFNIPKLDAHLREHYGDEFLSYERRTKRFIPFVL